MYIIEQEGHLGFWWDSENSLFVEKDAGIFPSRSDCLKYLQKFHSKEKAIEIIMSIKKAGGKYISF